MLWKAHGGRQFFGKAVALSQEHRHVAQDELVAGLQGVNGWRLPCAVVGAAVLGIWLLLWIWCLRSPQRPG
jgi:hypothetical protein